MGKVGKFILGAVLIVGGAAVGIFTGNWQLGITMASAGMAIITRPGVPRDLGKDQGAILQTRIGTQNAIPVIYGTTRIAGVYADVRVDPVSTNRKRLVLVIAWCLGSRDGLGIQAIDEVWFDDRLAISGSTVQAPFNTVVPNELVGGNPIKHLEFRHYLGLDTQTVDSRLNTLFPDAWPSSSTGDGIAYSVLELWYNTDIYGGGMPGTIQATIRGQRVEDPRTRAWAFSNNPALCIRDYLLSPIYGQAVPVGNLDVQDFIDMANHCDETVSIPGLGSAARYTLDGWVDCSRTVTENLGRLATACKGMIVNEGERWRLVIRRARVPTNYIVDETNTVEGSWKYVLSGADAPNIVRANYIDPLQKYQTDTVQWPDPGAANAYLVADNNYESRLELDLPYTANRARAQAMAMILLKEARQDKVVTVQLLETAISMRVGDIVAVTQPSPGWNGKLFDVLAILLQPDGGIQAILGEYFSTTYDLDAQNTPVVPPSTNLPNPFAIAAPTGLLLDGSAAQAVAKGDGTYIGRIFASWAAPIDAFLDFVEVQARQRITFLGTDADPVHSDQYEYVGFTEAAPMAISTLGLVVGDQISFQAEVWNTNAGANERVRVKFWTSGLVLISTQDGNLVNVTTPGTLSHFEGVAIPATTAFISARGITADGTPSRMRIQNALLYKSLQPYDSWGRVSKEATQQFYIVPAAGGVWDVQVRAVNRLGVTSSWTNNNVSVVDRPPQILTVTLASAHVDSAHSDVAHQDTAHSDVAHADSHSDAAHGDAAHNDAHSDTHLDGHQIHGNSHTDVAHADTAHSDTHSDGSHSDSAHIDSHTDIGHGDGNYGIGVAVQADAGAGSIRAVARKGGPNLLTNGGGETGSAGSDAPGWTQDTTTHLKDASDFVYLGLQALKIDNSVAADSKAHQDISVKISKTYRVHAWIKTSAMTAGATYSLINIDAVSGVTGFTIISKTTIGTDPAATEPDCGIKADGSAHAYTYVECVFKPTGADGTIRVYCQLGYGATIAGQAWFDDVWVQEIPGVTPAVPDVFDVRQQPTTDGRNIVVTLIDAATGGPLVFEPGDVANVAALAYSKIGGAGVEGPLALAQASRFTVVPVGTNKYVPA